MGKYILFILVTFYSQILQADHFYIFGGAGEKEGGGTIFDKSLLNLSEYFKKSKNWKIHSAFNGGNPETLKILNEKLKVKNVPFNSENFLASIKDLKSKLENNTPGSENEKYVIYIDGHAGSKLPNEITHSVVTNDEMKSLDKLSEVVRIARSRNIKLAIIDLSCYSGNLLKINPYFDSVCLISATGEKTFSFSEFSEKLTSELKSSKNLEEVFLKARANSKHTVFPMINTFAGKKINEIEGDFENNMLENHKENSSMDANLDELIQEKISKNNFCDKKLNYLRDELKASLLPIVNIIQFNRSYLLNSKNIKTLVNLYKKLKRYNELVSALEKKNVELKSNLNFELSMPNGKKKNMSLEEILKLDTVSMQNYYDQKILKSSDEKEKSYYLNSKKYYEEIENIKIRELKTPLGIKIQKDLEDIANISSDSHKLANEVSNVEKNFYESLYKELDKKAQKEKNPCRDFLL